MGKGAGVWPHVQGTELGHCRKIWSRTGYVAKSKNSVSFLRDYCGPLF